MSYFVISGNPRCACFGHALHVARYLNEKLPNFQYKKVEKLDSEWADHVLELNRENKWFIHKSPVIWKEINMWGGKKYLIGGISEFWEYVYCYYGLESLISKEETAKLAADNLKFFLEQHHADAERLNYVQNISILGACNPQTPILLHDLIELDEIKKISGVTFKLHDSLGHIEHKAMFMQECADLVNERCIYGHPDTVTVVCDEEDAIKYADIIIHVEDFSRHQNESFDEWLARCYSRMIQLSEIINNNENRNLRIILNNHGPVCFLATCLLEFCTRVNPRNIVAVTSDEGLSVINIVSERTGIPVAKIGAPPVWGFVGVTSFVDERHIVLKADMYMPYKRALTAPPGSTLPLGIMKTELRQMSYMLPKDDSIAEEVERRKVDHLKFHQDSYFPNRSNWTTLKNGFLLENSLY
ncbi:putative malate dehydrogenase 1B isoform X2 [Leptinotarsa decemlineata]|uniref:putative malate dehydrogenase 1B isoform X2 n=1 Tax=Leptinotarsa decemlineata TaxID=7539 RepID=UPI003D308092